MSAQSLVYLYNQRQLVVLLEHSSSPRRYEKVYAKDLIVNKGVDNIIEFAFVNQEQKPVDITNRNITCRILNHTGEEILVEKLLTHIYPLNGISSLRLTKSEIENISAQKCFYSLEIPISEFNYPVFVDSSGGARGVINIVDSVLPKHLKSDVITIPTHNKPLLGVPSTYYSSHFPTYDKPLFTFQYELDRFTGKLSFEGSVLADFAMSYVLTEVTHTDASGSYGLNVEGYHPFIRIKVRNEGTPVVQVAPPPPPVPVIAPAPPAPPPEPGVAYFRITDDPLNGPNNSNDFIIKMTNANKIQSARNQIAGVEPKFHITGIIIKQPVGYNPNYSYHYDPSTIDFFQVSEGTCDALFDYTEQNLNEAGTAFLPEMRLCPWASQLVEEVYYTPPPPPPPPSPPPPSPPPPVMVGDVVEILVR